MEHHSPESEKSWNIGHDLSDEFDFFFFDTEQELPEWRPMWDMASFTQGKGELKLKDWKISDDKMRSLAVDAIEFRKLIDGRAERRRG